MKKIFIIASILLGSIGLASANAALVGLSALGFFAFSHDWKKKTNFAGVQLYPAQITDMDGTPVPMWTRTQKYLADWLSKFGTEQTQANIKKGLIVWNPKTYYIRAAITAGFGKQTIWDQTVAKVNGIANMDKAILPAGYNFCFDRICVRYATTTVSATDSPKTATGWTSVRSSFPVGLGNGHLIMSLNDQQQIDTPVSDFSSEAAITGGGSRDFSGGELQVPRVWAEGLQIKAELDIPVIIPSAVNTSYFAEVMFYGIEARIG